jgi:hypothetical protein
MAPATRSAWAYYLDLIERQHGQRLVADLERAHCYRIRDGMADEPGKANNYMAKFKALLEFGAERGWIGQSGRGIPLLETGEHAPWPAHVLARALERQADAAPRDRHRPLLGPADQRCDPDAAWLARPAHDAAAQQEDRHRRFIPMHPLWLAEIDGVPRRRRSRSSTIAPASRSRTPTGCRRRSGG